MKTKHFLRALFSLLLGALFASIAVAQDILPFPPAHSASQAGVTIETSTYQKRVEPKRRAEHPHHFDG